MFKDVLKSLFLGFLGILTPIHMMMLVVGILIFTDLFLGIWAARKRGEKIESSAMRRTISKILVYQAVIITGFLCETYLLKGFIPISQIAAAAIGLVEMTSILENANSINGESIFKKLIERLGSDNDKKQN